MFFSAKLFPAGSISEAPSVSTVQDVFLFDLDAVAKGTCGPVDNEFAAYLRDFATSRPSYLLTSVNYNDLMSRVPSSVRRAFQGIFASCGAEVWAGDDLLECRKHTFSDDLYEYLVKTLRNSRYQAKLAPMIENGPATLRICLAGTRAPLSALKAYADWEEKELELPVIIGELEANFPDHRICQDTRTSFLIMAEAFSTAALRDRIKDRHGRTRVLAYLTRRAAEGFAGPFCEALFEEDLVSEVGGPSDLSQLLSYDLRRDSSSLMSPAAGPVRLR